MCFTKRDFFEVDSFQGLLARLSYAISKRPRIEPVDPPSTPYATGLDRRLRLASFATAIAITIDIASLADRPRAGRESAFQKSRDNFFGALGRALRHS
jgi:hypothetical protein